jgi:soluble lytic murein transglycosylase-like protein
MVQTPGIQSDTGSIFQSYRAQIDRLEADPNAMPEFKNALDAWLKAIEAVLGGQTASAPTEAMTTPTTDDPSGNAAPAGAPQPTSNYAAQSVSQQASGLNLAAGAPQALQALAPKIQAVSQATGVPANLLAAMIWQESRGNNGAVSTNANGAADSGLMQINADTFASLQAKHPELQGKSLSDPETNILAGALYLKDMKEQFGNWELTLRAYNSGPNSVNPVNADVTTTGLGDPSYVQKVMCYWQALDSGGGLPA